MTLNDDCGIFSIVKRWPRRNWSEIWKSNPELRRKMHCEGVVALMAREGVDVNIEDVYKYYDEVIAPKRDKKS